MLQWRCAGHGGADARTPLLAEGSHKPASDGQAVTPLLPAACQDATAILRAHALEEPVDALPAPVVRLKCPLHESQLLKENLAAGFRQRGPQYTGPRHLRQGNDEVHC